MAELRDRYSSHGFDENGNDNSMKVFEKATKQLFEFSKTFPKEMDKRESKREQEYQEREKRRESDDRSFRKALQDELGKSAKKTLGDGVAKVVQATIGGAGPIGYLLEKTLNLSGVTRALIDNFGRGGTASSKITNSQVTTPNQRVAENRKIDKETFESYPTIVKLRAWLNFQTKDNALFRKYMLTMQNRAKEQAKFEKEQTKLKKVFEKMQKGIDKQALLAGAMIAGVSLGVLALVGLTAVVGNFLYSRFGNRANSTAENFGNKLPKNYKNGEYAKDLSVSSNYGYRDAVVNSSGKVVSSSGFHKGIDIKGPAGTPVKSLTSGKAYPRMQTDSFRDYKVDSSGDKQAFKGYGRFIDVVCPPATAKRLGFPGQIVTIRYAHLQQILVKGQGVQVNKGQVIGTIGSSGDSSGPHLHIEILVSGGKAPNGSVADSWGYNTESNRWEMQHTLDPSKTMFFDSAGSLQSASGAFISDAKLDYEKQYHKASKNKSLNVTGKNEALMGANNMSIAGYQVKNGVVQPITQAQIIAPQTQTSNNTEVKLNFDVENPATKLLKQTDRTLDFTKI